MISDNSLVFAPKYGSPPKKPRDYVSFQGWARGFLRYHGQPKSHLVIIDNHRKPSGMRKQVLDAIAAAPDLTGCAPPVVAFFCHGYRTRIQLGFNRRQVNVLARALFKKYGPNVRVVLYACSAGNGPGHSGDRGFADELRDALCRAGATGCQVDAHVTAGRADANPFLRRFAGDGSCTGGTGGFYLVNRTILDERGRKKINPLWPKWIAVLKKKGGDMRWRFPFMSRDEILDYLT